MVRVGRRKKIALFLLVNFVINTIGTVAAPAKHYGITKKIAQVRAEYADCSCKGTKKHMSLTIKNAYDLDIAAMICAIVERAQALGLLTAIPYGVLDAYVMIQKNKKYIHEDDFIALMPLLEEDVLNTLFDADESSTTRALPNPGTILSDMSVAQRAFAVELLTSYQTTTTTLLMGLYDEAITDFSFTWTVIQNSTNLLQKDFTQTWTMTQNNANLVAKDFTQTWTSLSKIDKEFRQTWTLVQTAANLLQKDFTQTWTMTQSSSNLIAKDFAQTWTIIQSSTNLLQKDFTQTWTVLGGYHQTVADPTGSLSLCNTGGLKTLVTSPDLPDFLYTNSSATATCSTVKVNTTYAFDTIDNYNAPLMKWLKMIYILVRNINNEVRSAAAVNGAVTSIPNL